MKYPIGIQTFPEIIQEDYVYIDKTALIHQLVTQGKWYFLSRPRRFGKSLLISTLETLFQGEKVLFEGLNICDTDYAFDEHPVVKLEFTKAEINDAEGFRAYISEYAKELAREHQLTLSSDRFERQFDQVVSQLHRQTGKKVVLLVDEYDKPILNTLETTELDDIRRVMNAFYAMVKALDEHLKFAFITGVSKFSTVSAFPSKESSGMNNPRDISNDARYDTLCGYTKGELLKYFSDPIAELAEQDQKTIEQMEDKIAHWYNGYRFCKAGKGVYNPHSILSLFDTKEFLNYWFQTATPTFLINRLKAGDLDLSKVDGQKVGEGVFNAVEPEKMGIVPMLLQTGYLTIKDYQRRRYQLGFPNVEVERSFYDSLLTDYSAVDAGTAQNCIMDLADAFEVNQLDECFTLLQCFFAGVPYSITVKHEKYYQSLFFVIFSLLGFEIDAEVQTNIGRIDCVVYTQNCIYVIEFKLDGTKEDALQQIKDRQYAQKYVTSGREVVLVGVAFDHEQRNIVDWVEEALES